MTVCPAGSYPKILDISVVFWFCWCSRSCHLLIFFIRVPYSSPMCFALVNCKEERKYLSATKSSFFSQAFLLVLLLQTFVLLVLTIGHLWLFFNCNYISLATGKSYRSLAFQFRIHHSWISVIVRQTLNAICERLQKVAILEPNEETLKQPANGYCRRWHFPHCCGSIDEKHIRIIFPGNSVTLFQLQGLYSIVMLALVDHNYIILAVDVGSYGKEGDAGVFAKSPLRNNLSRANSRHQDHRQFYLT